MNLPNMITMGRVIAIPFFMYFLYTMNDLAACLIFAIASISDFLDGYLARKMNLVTNFGKFMDPTADKLLVYSALLLFIERGLMGSVLVTIIISRDFIINTMRSIAVEKNIVIPAMWSGKIKTTIQMIGIMLIMIFSHYSIHGIFSLSLTEITAIIITLVTIYSGVDYMIKMKDIFKDN